MVCMATLMACEDRGSNGVGTVVQTVSVRPDTTWDSALLEKLPLLGHRNWILVVDKAYPVPVGDHVMVINTGQPITAVLDTVIGLLEKQPHVKPIVYVDKEAAYLDESHAPGINSYRAQLAELMRPIPQQARRSLWHNDVFQQMDKAAALFQVIILKTESLIPYSSVFMELDCKYWDATREQALRKKVASQ